MAVLATLTAVSRRQIATSAGGGAAAVSGGRFGVTTAGLAAH